MSLHIRFQSKEKKGGGSACLKKGFLIKLMNFLWNIFRTASVVNGISLKVKVQ